MSLNFTPLMLAIEKYIAKEDSDLEEQLDNEGYVAANVAVGSIGDIEDGVTDAVQNHVDDVLAQISESSGVDDFLENVWPHISDSEDLTEALHDIFRQQFDDLMHSFTKSWIISVDPELAAVIDDRITNPAADFIKGWSQQLADIMNLNTKDGIEKILLDAQEQQLTIDEVSQAIADSGIRECGFRSRRVAVTEVLRVEEYAHQEARVQNPACYKKSWVHTGEAKVPRENHVAMHGQTVFKREPFVLTGRNGGTYYPMCPRDTGLPAEESINCHCRTDDIVDNDVLGMSLDDRVSLRQKYMDEVDAEYAAFTEQFERDYGDSVDWQTYNAKYEEFRRELNI